jgi:hypothetical protein
MSLPDPPLPSERKFGIFFTAIFALLAGWLGYRGHDVWAILAAAASLGIAGLALAAPHRLAAPNRWWFKFGLLLGRIVSPIVLGLLFFLLITPVALVIKLMRRDALDRRFDPSRASYWNERDPPGPTGESFRNQF